MNINKLYIISKINDPDRVDVAKLRTTIINWASTQPSIEYIPESYKSLCDQHTLIIGIGGDGTIVTAIQQAWWCDGYVLGINCGKLGFLAEVDPLINDIIATLQHCCDPTSDKFTCECRAVLSGVNPNDTFAPSMAVNEFHIKTPHSMLEYTLFVDGKIASKASADGLIISSATGSTAYNLSAGGAIMYPTATNMQIVPIAPHILNSRPLIIPDNCAIRIQVPYGNNPIVYADGRELIWSKCTTTKDLIWDVTVEPRKVNFVKSLDHNRDFFQIMASKLFWNHNTNI